MTPSSVVRNYNIDTQSFQILWSLVNSIPSSLDLELLGSGFLFPQCSAQGLQLTPLTIDYWLDLAGLKYPTPTVAHWANNSQGTWISAFMDQILTLRELVKFIPTEVLF